VARPRRLCDARRAWGSKGGLCRPRKVGAAGSGSMYPSPMLTRLCSQHFRFNRGGLNDSPPCLIMAVDPRDTTGATYPQPRGAGWNANENEGKDGLDEAPKSANRRFGSKRTHREIGQQISRRRAKAVPCRDQKPPLLGSYIPKTDRTDRTSAAELGTAGRLMCRGHLASLPRRPKAMAKGPWLAKAAELEHAAAYCHPKLGATATGCGGKGGKHWCRSSKKMAGPGQVLDVPPGTQRRRYSQPFRTGSRSGLNDAPRAGEILVAVAVNDSGPPCPCRWV